MSISLDRIEEIRECKNESYVLMLLSEIFDCLGIGSFVFVSMLKDSKSRETFRYIVGCKPEWCHIYNSNKWFANDPFASYACSSSKPILCSEMKSLSAGQLSMIKHGKEHGFRSGMVIPAHSGSNSRIGMLYVGIDVAEEIGEPRLMSHRTLLRVISQELLEWMIWKLQSSKASEISLSEQELALLTMAKNEYTAYEMKEATGLSESQINNRFRKINSLFNVNSKKEAAILAMEYGLISPL